MNKVKIKKGDEVVIIAGKGSINNVKDHKNKATRGKVLAVSPKLGKVLVEGVNIATKHKKPKNQQDKGGIVKGEAGIDVSNVMIICPACKKATRIAYKIEGENKNRACKKCGKNLDSKVEAKVETKKTAVKKEAK